MVKPNADGRRKIIAAIHRIALEPSPSPAVIATSTQHREQHENDDERPQQDSRQRSPPTPTRSERQAKRRPSPCPRPYARIAARASVVSTEEIAGKPAGSDGSRLVDERIGGDRRPRWGRG